VKQDEVLGRTGIGAYVRAEPTAMRHESLKGPWRLAEFVPKRHWNWKTGKWEHRMNLFRRRTIPPQSLVHDSAYLQGAEYQKFIPADAVRVQTRSARSQAT